MLMSRLARPSGQIFARPASSRTSLAFLGSFKRQYRDAQALRFPRSSPGIYNLNWTSPLSRSLASNHFSLRYRLNLFPLSLSCSGPRSISQHSRKIVSSNKKEEGDEEEEISSDDMSEDEEEEEEEEGERKKDAKSSSKKDSAKEAEKKKRKKKRKVEEWLPPGELSLFSLWVCILS